MSVLLGCFFAQVSYQQLYGWTMDEIVGQIGTRNNCTFCGVFRCVGCGAVRSQCVHNK